MVADRRAWSRYFTPSADHRRTGLACLGVGAQRGALPPVAARVLNCHAVLVVTEGRGDLELAGRRYPLVAPVLVWLVAGQQHSYQPRERGWVVRWALFDGPGVEGYIALGYLTPDDPVVPLADPALVVREFGILERICRQDQPDVLVDASVACHRLVTSVRQAAGLGSPATLAALRRDALRDLTVAERAARVGVSVGQLRTQVRLATGGTPGAYVLDVRIDHAKSLLVGTDDTIAAVARKVGYDDAAYFSRLFHNRVGQSPRRFRAQQPTVDG